MQPARSNSTLLIVGIVIALLCLCIVLAGLGAYVFFAFRETLADLPIEPDFGFGGGTPTLPPVLVRPSPEAVTGDTLETLRSTIVPENDPRDLSCRLEGKCDIPETMSPPAAARVPGDRDTFWVTNVETNENYQVDAVLRYVTPRLYFWVEDGARYDQRELETLADTFENTIYETNREFFGSEWTPGIDQDPHVYILYAGGIGASIAGYFSSADEIHPLAHEYSNAHEMFLFNSDNTDLGDEFTYGVLAHEFQHMIHWYQDRNETSWINEGFSEVAAFLNGYDPGGFDWLFMRNPDLQLNDWPNDQSATSPHYGASFLFLTYFLDRFGEDATKALVREADNGFDSVDKVLASIGAHDDLTSQPTLADDVFMDWALANYLHDDSVGDGRFTYHNYQDAPQASPTESVTDCATVGPMLRNVHQYAADYIEFECQGDLTLSFSGSTATGLLPDSAYSGDFSFWSNKGDESNMTLTRAFDFTGLGGPIAINFKTWYDLEVDYDYLYLEASEDGEHWQILITPSGTAEDPSGNSFGWGYNGVTAGWIDETVDLSQYAGKAIWLRFEYVTDAAVNGEGLLLDDVSVDAAGYFTDFEADDGGWVADGFARVQNTLPQTFRLALILRGADTTVQSIPVRADQSAEINLSLGAGDRAVLVVAGTTRFTRELASYQIDLR